jgi:glycosyltransferase involved in cell wall biosynthesis
MKRFLVYAPNDNFADEPAFRIRLLDLQPLLAQRGIDWHIVPRPKMPWQRVALARSARNYDGVILHKKMLDPFEAHFLRRAVRPPRKIFMDIDDATMYHEKQLGWWARRRLDRRFAATARILDVVCAGNPYLGDIFRQQGVTNIHLFPTVVDPAHYPVKQHVDTNIIKLAWIGSRSTRKFLEALLPDLATSAQQLAAHGIQLRVLAICDRPPQTSTDAALPIDFVPWSLQSEGPALASADIGIAPTPETPFTLGKCGFKIVQYMAAGLPVIASPVGANIDLVNDPTNHHRTGLLPRTPDEWISAITQLATDTNLRRTLGAAGRQRIESELCLEKIADRWVQLLTTP